MKKPPQRGMFLITTLILIAFLVMLSTTMIVSIMTGLGGAGSFNTREVALHAARAGLLYVQARLESSMYNYSPGTPIAGTFGDGANFTVKETGRTIVGVIDNGNVAGAGDKRVFGVFRCTFSSSPSAYVGADNPSVSYGVYTIPSNTYVSINNLSSDVNATATCFKADSSIHQTVPGQAADVVVEGYASAGDGNLLGHRTVEAIYSIAQIGNLPPVAAISRLNMDLTMTDSALVGGSINVGISPGTNLAPGASGTSLASSAGNIVIGGVDAYSGGPPASIPGYTQTTKSSIPTAGNDFFYNQTPGGMSGPGVFNNMYNTNPITPPAITAAQLPGVRGGAGQLDGGTWVFWNGQPYHYPTDYKAIDGSGNPVTITSQVWAGGSGASPPTLNGVGPNPPGPQVLPAGVAFDATQNQLTVSTNDLQAKTYTNGGFTSSNLAMMVAPAANQPSTADSFALQILFQPPPGATTPQINVPGDLTIVGNVVGKGSLITTPSGSNGDIIIQGKSQLDPAPDSGVALYSSGSTNLFPLDPQQLPQSIQALVPPSGGSGTALVNQAIAEALQQDPGLLAGPDMSGNYTFTPGGGSSAASALKDYTVTIPGYGTNKLQKILPDVLQNGTNGHCAPPANDCGHSYKNPPGMEPSINTFASNLATAFPSGFQLTDLNSIATSGIIPGGPSPSPSGSGTGVPNPDALNQVFNGLVYTSHGFNVSSTKSISIDGALIDYSGNPNTGTTGPGGVTMDATATSVMYDTSRLNQFASWFGGQVTLATTLVSSY